MKKTATLNRREISRNLSSIEMREPKVFSKLSKLFSSQALRRSVCFTGPGGVGKSSLLSRLAPLAAQKKLVAWLACDPSSPISGGSLLGDRIRVGGAELSESIYIRSLSTRSQSAFAQSIRDMEIYLESIFDWVWVETAGSGQTQSDIAQISGITVLILQPHIGDEVQWIKSGLKECADLFVINKSDLGGAERIRDFLIQQGATSERVFTLSGQTGEGAEKLLSALEALQTDAFWEGKRISLHQQLARSLFEEIQLQKLQKQYDKHAKAWQKNPYRMATASK